MSTKTRTRYALFAWEHIKKERPSGAGAFTIFWDEPKEKWQEDDEGNPKRRLVFVDFVSSPAEVVALVRKDPTKEYVLMTGTISGVKIAMPVFVDGKNLSTLNHEWGESE